MKKYPSYCCQNCGELIGWIGRIMPFHKCKAGRTMNERIKQFEKQCWDHQTNHLDTEKFAELIVRECLDQCYNRGMNDELYAGQLRAAEYIEQHFGVEE